MPDHRYRRGLPWLWSVFGRLEFLIERDAMPEYYEIKIKGHLDPSWSDRFAGLKLTHLEGDGTLLSGPLADQAALHGLLELVRDLNLTLISVTCGGSPARDTDEGVVQ